MKLFDRVSEDANKALTSVDRLEPSKVWWGDGDNWDCPITPELVEFFFHEKRLCGHYDESLRVHLTFERNVPDGVLKTRVSIVGSKYWECADIDIDLCGRDIVQTIAKLAFRTNTADVSPKTVRHIHDWVRNRARPHFQKAKEAFDTDIRMRKALREKYKP